MKTGLLLAAFLLAVLGIVRLLEALLARVLRWYERRSARRRAKETLEAWWNDADDSRLDEIDGSDGNDEGIVRATR